MNTLPETNPDEGPGGQPVRDAEPAERAPILPALLAFGVEAGPDGNRVVVTLKNISGKALEVAGVYVCGPASTGEEATVMTAPFEFLPDPSFAGSLRPGKSGRFLVPAWVLDSLRGGLPLNWSVVAKGGGKVLAEVPAQDLVLAAELCCRL